MKLVFLGLYFVAFTVPIPLTVSTRNGVKARSGAPYRRNNPARAYPVTPTRITAVNRRRARAANTAAHLKWETPR